MNMEEIKERVRELIKEELGIQPRVKVFGFGGGAGRIVEYISKKGVEGVKTIAVNVDRKIEELNVDKRMLVGKDVLGEHKDTNGEINVGEYIIDDSKAWLIEEARDADVIVLISSLGGGMGTGGIIETMKILKEKTDRPMVSIVVMPFSFERDRRERAEKVVEELKRLEKTIVIDSDTMLKSPQVKIANAYEKMYEEIFEFIGKIANIAKREIEKKFEEMYLSNMDSIIEEKYKEVIGEMSVAA